MTFFLLILFYILFLVIIFISLSSISYLDNKPSFARREYVDIAKYVLLLTALLSFWHIASTFISSLNQVLMKIEPINKTYIFLIAIVILSLLFISSYSHTLTKESKIVRTLIFTTYLCLALTIQLYLLGWLNTPVLINERTGAVLAMCTLSRWSEDTRRMYNVNPYYSPVPFDIMLRSIYSIVTHAPLNSALNFALLPIAIELLMIMIILLVYKSKEVFTPPCEVALLMLVFTPPANMLHHFPKSLSFSLAYLALYQTFRLTGEKTIATFTSAIVLLAVAIFAHGSGMLLSFFAPFLLLWNIILSKLYNHKNKFKSQLMVPMVLSILIIIALKSIWIPDVAMTFKEIAYSFYQSLMHFREQSYHLSTVYERIGYASALAWAFLPAFAIASIPHSILNRSTIVSRNVQWKHYEFMVTIYAFIMLLGGLLLMYTTHIAYGTVYPFIILLIPFSKRIMKMLLASRYIITRIFMILLIFMYALSALCDPVINPSMISSRIESFKVEDYFEASIITPIISKESVTYISTHYTLGVAISYVSQMYMVELPKALSFKLLLQYNITYILQHYLKGENSLVLILPTYIKYLNASAYLGQQYVNLVYNSNRHLALRFI